MTLSQSPHLAFENGKYTAFFDGRGSPTRVFRYGEEWRDIAGDKFTCMLIERIQELENEKLSGAPQKVS